MILLLAVIFLFLSIGENLQAEISDRNTKIRILTINVWSGLDYQGVWKFGEYESEERREARFQSCLTQIRVLDPDIVFIQEANPIGRYSKRLADSLGFDEIHQVCVGGIKFGPLGIPSNFKEGIAILARPSTGLEKIDVWKLAGSFGLFGDAVTFHFDESIFSLVGKIVVHNTPIYLVNVHLSSVVPEDSLLKSKYHQLLDEKKINSEEWQVGSTKREDETAQLLKHLRKYQDDYPIIVAGDLNAAPTSREIKTFLSAGNFIDAFTIKYPDTSKFSSSPFTWDFSRNENIAYSTHLIDSRGDSITGYELLNALYDTSSRRIDYIFLNNKFSANDIINSDIVLDSAVNGIHPSDHFGMFTEIDLSNCIKKNTADSDTASQSNETVFEPLPIFSYDTDVGFGYGVKAFLLSALKLNESFDAMLFNSTKGERWYRFVFSLPDYELRQGKKYDIAIDLTIDYDKWIRYNYFGIGNSSRFSDREFYMREPLEISLTLSRGLTPKFIGQIGFTYKSIKNSNFEKDSKLKSLIPSLNSETVTYTSIFTTIRYDTRNSFINPTRGLVLQGELEYAPRTKMNNVCFTRTGILSQYYYTLIDYPKTILATRLKLQNLSGSNLPVQVLLPIGGGNTLRGSPQDRFLDKVSAIGNIELRFPLFGRLGGIAGYDVGKVWYKIQQIDLDNWASNPIVGLRFYLDTYIVRLDVGLGKETTGFYLNFNHVF
jgi:endonuclease/exonuclease/phosphatase family metal-dependent hydrolase